MGPSLRRMGKRWSGIRAAVAALGLAACSGGPAAPSPSAVVTTPAADALQQPGVRCGGPDTQATLVRFAAADGTGLNGVLAGTGSTGVVLVHESQPEDLCGLWPFADFLARRGLVAFAVDLRCFGRSACPAGEAAGRVVDDVAAAVAELRRRGVARVAVVGASMGGAAALIAGTRVRPPLAAVVSLSGEPDPTELVGGIPLDAAAVIGQLRVPTMFVVATHDRYVSVEQTRALHRAVRTKDKQLLTLSGEFDGRHGRELLVDRSTGRFSSVATRVAAFLAAPPADASRGPNLPRPGRSLARDESRRSDP